MNETDLILRIVIAAIFGGVIGWERQKDGKPAGLRTHMLVSTGAALFTIISFAVMSVFEDSVIDPTRIAAGIITGVAAAVLVLLLLWPATVYTGAKTVGWFGGFNLASYYAGNFALIFFIIMGSGILLGAIASVFAIRRYLKV